MDLRLSSVIPHRGTSDARESIVAVGFIGCDFANKRFIITSSPRLAAKKGGRAAKEGPVLRLSFWVCVSYFPGSFLLDLLEDVEYIFSLTDLYKSHIKQMKKPELAAER